MYLPDHALDHLRSVVHTPDLGSARYEVEAEIGRGGIGVVYKVRDHRLHRSVALKVIDEVGQADAAEARIIAQLEHPGIVPLYDAGELPDGRPYYVMKLVSGARLDEFLAAGGALAERLLIFQKICDAVGFAHSRGVVHRDLKPQNIMIGEFGEVLVMDWGVAKRVDEAEPPGTVAGTPKYMAPEPDAGPRGDIYSLGALLEELAPAPRAPALSAIAAKAKAVRPEDRYASADALAADVARFLDRMPVTAHRETAFERVFRFASRNRTLLLLIAAYVLVRVIFLVFR